MNLNEIARVTIPPLPNPNDGDQKNVNRKLIDAIGLLFKRDQEKEQRIRELERKVE